MIKPEKCSICGFNAVVRKYFFFGRKECAACGNRIIGKHQEPHGADKNE